MPSEERLHPVSILFSFGRSLKAFALPGLVGLVIAARRPGPNVDAWMMLFLIPAAVVAIVRYLSFRMRYEGTELVIRSGLIFRNERHIPYARIQNLDAVQNVFHRLLRVIEVRVETGAGSEPEATISVLPAAALDEMRRRVFGREVPAEEVKRSGERILLEMPLGELLLHGFLVNRGMVVIGAIYGLLWQLDVLDRLWGPIVGEQVVEEGMIRELIEGIVRGAGVSLNQVAVAAAAVMGFLIVVRIASMCWAAVRLYGFQLTAVGEDLRIEYRPVDSLHGHDSGPADSVGDDHGRAAVPPARSRVGPGRNGWRTRRSGQRRECPRVARAADSPRGARTADGRSDGRRSRGREVVDGLDARSSAGVPARRKEPRVPGDRHRPGRGRRRRLARTARGRSDHSVEHAGCAPSCRTPGLDGRWQPGRVQERVALAQRDDRAGVAHPGGDARRIAVRSPRLDGARPGRHGRRERTLASDRHPVPCARPRRGTAAQAGGARRRHAIPLVARTDIIPSLLGWLS